MSPLRVFCSAVLLAACSPASSTDHVPPTPSSSGTVAASSSTTQAPPPAPSAVAVADADKAVAVYLDARSQAWLTSPPRSGQRQECALSCHTSFPFMLSRRQLGNSRQVAVGTVVDEVRKLVEKRVAEGADWTTMVPWYGKDGSQKARESVGSEAVLNAASLVFDDQARDGKLSAIGEAAIAKMWQAQRSDGGFDWLDFGLEPWEAGNETWGAAMAAITVGTARRAKPDLPDGGTIRLLEFLRTRTGGTLHDRMMLLWATSALDGVGTDSQRATWETELLAAQLGDGGWSITTLLGREGSANSDAYATAAATLVLCSLKAATGPSSDNSNSSDNSDSSDSRNSASGKGVAWLQKKRQPASEGANWRAKSANSGGRRAAQFMTDAATAYALLALAKCDG